MENKLNKGKKMNINFMIDKMKSLMKEKRVMSSKWAKKIGLELLEQDLTPEQKVEVLSYLVTIALKLKNNEDVERFGNEILRYDILNNMSQSIKDRLRKENFFKAYIEMKQEEAKSTDAVTQRSEEKPKRKNKHRIFKENFYERFDNGNFLTTEDLKLSKKSYIAKNYYTGENSKYNRTNLYNGNIKLEDLKGLAEENSKTLAGNIFIAEACKYFNLEQLGMKCLKSFKTNNSSLTAEEKRAIVQAEEILKIKKPGFFRAKWNKIYEYLHKASKENETKNEERY